MASQGINNAGEYFEAVRNPQSNQPEQITTQQINQRGSRLPERRIAPGETKPYPSEVKLSNDPFPKQKFGGEIHTVSKTPDQTMKRPLVHEINYQIENAQAKFQAIGEEPGNEALKLLTIPEKYVYGIFKGSRDLGSGVIQTTKQVIQEKNPFIIVENVGEGISQQTETIIKQVVTGDAPGLVQSGGEVTSQIYVGKGIGSIKAKWLGDINEAKISLLNQAATEPVTNPLFQTSTLFNDLGIKNINPQNIPEISTMPRPKIEGVKAEVTDPMAQYYLIPPEYTEIGKNFNPKEAIKPSDSFQANEIKPGNIIKELQPTDFESKLYYKMPGNKPPELQTRLDIKEAPTNNIIRSPEEIIELSRKSTQMKIGQDIGRKTDFFENPERKAAWQIEEALKKSKLAEELAYKEKLSKEAADRNNNLILSTQPALAVGMIIVQEIPKITDTLKSKYAIYKEGLKADDIIIREAPITSFKSPIITPIMTSTILNPTKTGSFGGSVTIIKQNPISRINTESNIKTINLSKTGTGIKTRLNQRQATSQKIIQEQAQAQIQEQTTAQTQTQKQTQATSQITTQKQILKQPTINTLKIGQVTPPTNKTPFPKMKSKQNNKEISNFNVKVRKKGIFQTVGREENIQQAINLGENIVKNTAAASFKLEENGKTITGFNPGRNFKQSKRETGVFIQERSNRINTAGEKREITRKGIFTNRIKNKQRRVNKWEF